MNEPNRTDVRNIEETGKLMTESAAGSDGIWKTVMIAAAVIAVILIGSGLYLVISNI